MYNRISKIKIVMMILLPLFFVFLGFNNVSAIENLTFTSNFDTSSDTFTSLGDLCSSNPNQSPNSCSDYKYIMIEQTIVTSNSALAINGTVFTTSMGSSKFMVIELPENALRVGFWGVTSRSATSSDYIKFTLSESLPGASAPTGSLNITENGTFDVSEVASVNVNVPQDVTEIIEDPVSNDFHNIFLTVVTGIIPAFAVFIIVWFAIDLMSSLFFGRGK